MIAERIIVDWMDGWMGKNRLVGAVRRAERAEQ